MKIDSLVLSSEKEIPFENLEKIGWKHPTGLRDEPMENSLVKQYGCLDFQVVRHLVRDQKWIAVYVHNKSDVGKIIRQGQGTSFTVKEMIEALGWLAVEMDTAVSL